MTVSGAENRGALCAKVLTMDERVADSRRERTQQPVPLTARQAAATLGLHERTVRRAIHRGELKALKHNGVFQIAHADLMQFRDAHLARMRTAHARPILMSLPRSQPAWPRIPTPLTPLVGRVPEVASLQELLLQPDGPRLLVLTGPGGVGKSRLAQAVAVEVADRYADGIAFIPLTSTRDPAFVPAAIAKAIGVHETSSRTLLEQLVIALRDKHALLILDNFEQVLEAGPVVSELLAACPRLRVLVTSQARLRLSAEHTFTVSPLPLPNRGCAFCDFSQIDAVRLFVDRARAANPTFLLTENNAAAVEEICRRLEGMPLAIELAAARSSVLPPAAMLARLDRRLPLLIEGPRDVPARLQTMRNAIAWSYDLLSHDERAFFRQMAIFVGGFTLDAAAWIWQKTREVQGYAASESPASPGTPPSPDVFELVARLVDKSLLRRSESPEAELRFEMLETIREFGLEQLQAQGELDAARRNHAAYVLGVAEAADQMRRGPEQIAQLARLEAEHDNIRAALSWSLTVPTDAELGLRLVGALHWFWYLRDHYSEGRQWLERVLSQPAANVPTPARVKALASAGLFVIRQFRDYATARSWLEESIALGRSLGDTAGLAYSLQVAVWIDLFQAEHGELWSAIAESVALYRALGDRWGLAAALCILGMAIIAMKNPSAARAAIAESLALSRELGDTWGLARALHYSGEVARFEGHDDEARVLYEESLIHYHALEHRGAAAILLHNLGYVALHQGDHQRALTNFAEALVAHISYGDRQNIGYCLGGIAGTAARLQQPTQAARLFGTADRLFAELGTSIWPVDKVDYERNMQCARNSLGEAAFAAAFATGRSLPTEAAISEALSFAESRNGVPTPAAIPMPQPAASGVTGLTRREREILLFVVRHATDREIAEELSISPRTVMHHVSHILAKLGASNRRDAAERAMRAGLI